MRPPTRAHVALLLLSGVLLASCAGPMARGTSVCDYVQVGVDTGELPVSLAQTHYPECRITGRRQ